MTHSNSYARTPARRAADLCARAAYTAMPLAAYFGMLVVSFLLAYLADHFTRSYGNIAVIWPVNAAILVLILKWPRAYWAAAISSCLAGTILANLLVGDSLLRAAILTAANGAEISIIGVILARRFRSKRFRLSSLTRVFAGTIMGCLVSTVITGTGFLVMGEIFGFFDLAVWFSANLLGLLLFGPLIWALVETRFRPRKTPSLRTLIDFGVVIAITFAVFAQTQYPLLFLIPPVLVIVAFSQGVRGASIALLFVTIISVCFALADVGPTHLINADSRTKMIVLQVFLAANSFMGLALGATATERRGILRRLNRARGRIESNSVQLTELLAAAQLAEQVSHVGHWTLTPQNGEISWSPEVYRIHGVDPDAYDPMFEDLTAFFDEKDRGRINQLIADGIANHTGWKFEAEIVRRSDQTRRTIMAIGQCIVGPSGSEDKFFGVFKDMTEQRQLYNALTESEAQYRLLAAQSTDIILRFGLDGIITYASPACRILGLTQEEAVGRSTLEMVIPEDREFAATLTRALFDGSDLDPAIRREYRVRSADGSVLWLEGNPKILHDAQGNPSEVVSTFRDVTDRVHREEALSAAREEAVIATRAKAEFLSNMSHEIRTPLNGVLGFTQLLSQSELSRDQRSHINRINSAGRTLLDIVNDVLDFSKIEAGRMDVENRPFDLDFTVDDVIALIRASRLESDVKITKTTEFSSDVMFLGDETRMRQILTNIIGNAAKFTTVGEIDVQIDRTGDLMSIIVSDTGPGIPADKVEQIFEGFLQADNSITRRYGGTGLGLSISRSLARLLGGDLTLQSVAGQGTRVTLSLPNNTAPMPNAAPIPVVSVAANLDPVAVMVVDDVEMNRELIEIWLRNAGHAVTGYASAITAIENLRGGAQFDIILMDVQMPDMDGLTATQIIRSLPGQISQVPIVALTANAQLSQVEDCLAAGMDQHVPKPIDLPHLITVVQELTTPASQQAQKIVETVDDEMDVLKSQYLTHMKRFPGEIQTILAQENASQHASDIQALAHSIAGTAGSFGFMSVSDAAFELESLAQRIIDGETPHVGLKAQVKCFVDHVAKITS